LSPFIAASATGLFAADAETQSNSAAKAAMLCVARIFVSLLGSLLYEIRQRAGTIADAVLVNTVQIQYAQQKISRWDHLARILQVPIAFELPGRSTDQQVRHVVMKMLIGIAHVAAI
jgi:hypothetical protein